MRIVGNQPPIDEAPYNAAHSVNSSFPNEFFKAVQNPSNFSKYSHSIVLFSFKKILFCFVLLNFAYFYRLKQKHPENEN